MGFDKTEDDDRYLRYGKLFYDRFMDLKVDMGLNDALDLGWKTLVGMLPARRGGDQTGIYRSILAQGQAGERAARLWRNGSSSIRFPSGSRSRSWRSISASFPPWRRASSSFSCSWASSGRRSGEQEEAPRERCLRRIALWSALIRDLESLMRYFLEIEEVRFSLRNVAGLKIPRFEEVVFEDPSYSVFATAYSFEMVLARLREAIGLREEIRILKEQERISLRRFPQDEPADQPLRAAADPRLPGGAAEDLRLSSGPAGRRRRCGQGGQASVGGNGV